FLRGVATLVEAIKLGSEALRFSSEIYERDHFDDGPAPPRSGGRGAFSALAYSVAALATSEPEPGGSGPGAPSGQADKGRKLLSIVTIGFAILLFVVLPQAAASFASRAGGFALDLRSPLFQALTGAFKL